MRSTMTKLMLAGAMFVAGMTAAYAQPGGQMVCNNAGEGGGGGGCAGIVSTIQAPWLPPGGVTVTTQGASTFNIVAQNASPVSYTLSIPAANGWTGTGFDPFLGAVTWSWDPAQPAPLSTIVANQPGPAIPATGDLYFGIRGTMAAKPGITYRSMGFVHVRNANLTSYNPHICQTYTLVNPVNFEDVAVPGVVAFTLTGLNVTLNN